ncbi:clathrin light chain 2-like isoform X3 [Hevea brasiliensis]|uniref:clathrin light chain 2-like isoform X3 n=1 Tax=Hevea brasiliensis TaxID=3981 RepID=UPI0025DFC9EA|nr:clathrin light chain 2-like isoform X3 [Hevea brasiliensis]
MEKTIMIYLVAVLIFRENAIRLEEKEKREKELLSQMIEEAGEYKVEFYRKREVTCENNKVTNREKEKAFARIIP